MRGLLFLTLVWLVAQFGGLLFDIKTARPLERPRSGDVETVIHRWPKPSQRLAHQMIDRYGVPDAVIDDDQLMWKPRGVAAIVLYRDSTSGPALVD